MAARRSSWAWWYVGRSAPHLAIERTLTVLGNPRKLGGHVGSSRTHRRRRSARIGPASRTAKMNSSAEGIGGPEMSMEFSIG